MVERKAYKELFQYIRTDIIPNKKVTRITSLTSKLESFMLSGGVDYMHESTRKHIHRRLTSELKNSVIIFPDEQGKLLLVPDSVSLQDVIL